MRYVFESPKGEREEFRDPCERMKENLINDGYTLIGHITNDGKFYEAERGRRARLTQTKAFDEMIERTLWSVDERQQLKDWGVI